MGKKILLLIMVCFSLAVGGFWALKAQDPPGQVKPTPPAASTQQTMQTDLSGTYTGTFDCEPLGLTGETTLTISGNEFTTADGKTGRIVASTTHGYTAVALQMGGMTAPAATTVSTTPAPAPVVVSARARKSGSRLILTPVSGATMKCSFTPGRSVARGKRNRTPAATGTEVSAPATAPVPAESPMPSQTPAPSPVPSPTPEPSPTGTPTPEPSPTPSGSPTPTPSPSPAEPAPSPTPTPSPSPRG